MCDAVFGAANFRNEISWQTGGNAKNTRKLNRYHDTIIVYANGPRQVFHPLYFPYGDEYMKKSNVKECPTHHKKYVTTALHNSQPDVNPRPNLRYEWNGHAKQWYVTADKMRALHDDARLEYSALGVPRIKRFLDEMEGVPLRDVWTDITNVQGGEKLAYATQKPVKLLERIVRLYTDEGAVCMDIFAGSGTLGRAALACGRRYVLYDQNPDGKAVFDESIR
jgi:hypothetical protein